MGIRDDEGTDQEGYRLLLPKRAHLLDRLFTSRVTLELTPKQITVIEQNGPMTQRFHHDWGTNSTFHVETKLVDWRTPGGETHGIRVDTVGSEFWLGLGYPPEKLREVVGQLERIQGEYRDVMRTPKPWVPGSTKTQPVKPAANLAADSIPDTVDELVAPPSAEPAAESVSRPPSPQLADPQSTEIQYQSTDEGILIHVPASGLRKGTHGLWAPFAFFAAVIGIIMAGVLIGALPNAGDLLGAIPVVLMFGGVFAGLGVALLNMARRSATLEVDGTKVRIHRKTMFKDETKEYARADITDVKKGNSTLQINGQYVEELQISVRGKLEVRMLSQRKPEEIRRVAEAMLASLSKPGSEGVA